MQNLQQMLVIYLKKIAQHNKKTIEEKMEEQDRPTIPAEQSKDEAELYKKLLELIESDKKKELPKELEIVKKEAAPKGVKDKTLWNKIEKRVRKHNKYTDEQVYKVVQKAYQRAGGSYTHKA